MTSRFRHVALIGKYQASGARAQCGALDDVMAGIGAFLESQGCEVFVEQSQAEDVEVSRYAALSVEEIGQRCDLGLVVGGDGTMLGIGRQLAPYGVPLIGINRGRLGFITDISLDHYQATLIPMLAGEYEEDHRSLMHAHVMRDGVSVFDALAMNDVVVNRGATTGMVELRVSVGRHFVANQRADGMIIASPTGSTAYALSAGGPLLHPAVPGWVLVPIAPHTLSNRPILLPDADEVSIELVAGRDASANFDMQSLASLSIGDRVVVRRSDYHVRFLHPKGWSYFDTLRKKLHWNEGVLEMALRRIALRDFVIVRALELDLSAGFTVLTGETGAGKSILIDALQLALGNRADAGAVREGAERLDVSAEFDLDPALAGWLDDGGFEAGDALLLRRTVDLQGRSRGWINGTPATASQLRELGDRLLDIHGQHAWQSLTRPEAVRGLLDAYANISTAALQGAWQDWRQAGAALTAARAGQDSLQRERERLQWQVAEVMKLAPRSDEWEELSSSHTRISNAQALIDAAEGASHALEDDDNGALVALSRAVTLLQNCEHIEPEFKALGEVLASSVAQASDAAHSLHGYLRETDADPRRLAELDERMGLWMSLARRYKRPPAELPSVLAGWQTELSALDAQSDLDALERAELASQQVYMKEARAVAKARKQAAPKLGQAVTLAMQGLGMQGGRFEVSLQPLAEPGRAGLEDVAFLVSGHTGSTPRPIGKVASGGELSRIALAIAVTTSELGAAQTLIFDEVDAGVGGAVAETVGRLMKQLGRDRQVLAVTHLPQVAACADHHLVVAKRQTSVKGEDGVRTESGVAVLDGDSRTREIARMLGGERVSQTSLAHAREMLGRKSPETSP